MEEIYDLDRIIEEEGGSPIPVLHSVQNHYGYLPEEILKKIAHKIQMPLIELYRIATFYDVFSLTPKGKNRIVVCSGTACHVKGADSVTEEISRSLNVMPGETTADGEFSLEKVGCLGACALAPLVVVNGEYEGNMTPSKIREKINKIKKNGGSCKCSQ